MYVLNSADQGGITGFRLTGHGKLVPVPGSTRELKANQQRFTPDRLYNSTQVSFTPDGGRLVVSIKDGPDHALAPGTEVTGPGRVLTFDVDRSGRPANSFVSTDIGHRGPFPFSFDLRGNLLVGEFVGGPVEELGGVKAITGGAAGSCRINRNGTLTPITPGVANHQQDTCWLVNNGRSADGANDSRHLYVVLPGSGKVAGWQIRDDGSLRTVGGVEGLPQTVNGDQAPVDFGAGGSPAGLAVS